MRLKVLLVAMIAALSFAGFALADDYKVDPAHSSVNFNVQHMKAGYVFGRFDKVEGTIAVDSDASKMKFDVTVHADSIDTGVEARDKHIKGPDLFSVKEFPTITFKSKEVKAAGDDTFEVSGDMMLHGVTKPMTISIKRTGSSSGKMGTRQGYLATFTVKRTDFGMSAMTDMIGDEVQLTVALEGVKQ